MSPLEGSAPPADDITVLLVTYNSAAILPWSLEPLSRHPHVIVVDNASRDDTLPVVRRLLPQARVIEAGANLGFGRANNLGLQAAATPLVLVLNPDCRVADDALEALGHAARRWPQAALLAPLLYDAPGRLGDSWRGVGGVPTPPQAERTPPDGDVSATFVTGAAMLVRRQQVLPLGGFDPWFFLYHEDDELCGRIRQAGLDIVVVADARAEHHTRSSSPSTFRTSWRRHYCMALSKLYMLRKRQGGAWKRQAWLMGIGSFAVLPLHMLTLRRDRIGKHLARVGAAAMAWRHLRRPHCFEPEN